MMIVAAQGVERGAAVRGEFDRIVLAANLAQERFNFACLARVVVDEQQADRILNHRFPLVQGQRRRHEPRGRIARIRRVSPASLPTIPHQNPCSPSTAKR
ncbi:MAG: hypothetical protein M3Q38_06350 [Chloroflexota bacterium]|nr:hypothetical protein [Chloroflexota bacterium]